MAFTKNPILQIVFNNLIKHILKEYLQKII